MRAADQLLISTKKHNFVFDHFLLQMNTNISVCPGNHSWTFETIYVFTIRLQPFDCPTSPLWERGLGVAVGGLGLQGLYDASLPRPNIMSFSNTNCSLIH